MGVLKLDATSWLPVICDARSLPPGARVGGNPEWDLLSTAIGNRRNIQPQTILLVEMGQGKMCWKQTTFREHHVRMEIV